VEAGGCTVVTTDGNSDLPADATRHDGTVWFYDYSDQTITISEAPTEDRRSHALRSAIHSGGQAVEQCAVVRDRPPDDAADGCADSVGSFDDRQLNEFARRLLPQPPISIFSRYREYRLPDTSSGTPGLFGGSREFAAAAMMLFAACPDRIPDPEDHRHVCCPEYACPAGSGRHDAARYGGLESRSSNAVSRHDREVRP
jgi:hypothetical protein